MGICCQYDVISMSALISKWCHKCNSGRRHIDILCCLNDSEIMSKKNRYRNDIIIFRHHLDVILMSLHIEMISL